MYPSRKLIRHVAFATLFFLYSIAALSAPNLSRNERIDLEALTQTLVGLNAERANRQPASSRIIELTVERQALMAELIERDPGAVLRTAIPERIRKNLPPEIGPFLERHLQMDGRLEVMYEDRDDGTYKRRYFLTTDEHRVALYFSNHPPPYSSGTRVSARGVHLDLENRRGFDGAMALESGASVLTLALDGGVDGGANSAPPAPAPHTFGEQSVAVILVNFTSVPLEPWTPMFAHNMVFSEVNDFFMENSFGQTWLSGDVFGWYTLELDPEGCPSMDIASGARNAALADGINLSDYDRLVFAFPNIGCSWSGLASVGDSPSNAWFDGTLDSAGTVSHELGHNFGLFHSHSHACSGALPLSEGCITSEYGDVLDRMGSIDGGHFNAFQKERLGWLAFGQSPEIVTADVSGTYTLDPYAAPAGGIKGMRILRDSDPVSGQPRWYYLESRQAYGSDEYLSDSYYGPSALNGIVFRLATWGDGNSSKLLHMTPDSPTFDWRDLALAEGASYSDDVAGVTITVQAVDANGASVMVDYGAKSCVRSNPTITASPDNSDWVDPGTQVIYSLTIWNQDSQECEASDFTLDTQVPAGWTASLSESVVALAPGENAAISLYVTSDSEASDGVYDVASTVTHGSDAAYHDAAVVSYTVSATVVNPNTPPVAVDDAVVLVEKAPVIVDVLVNDNDPDNDPVYVSTFSQGSKGTVDINADGTLTYTPGKRFKDKDSFTYEISDGDATATATVSITLEATAKGGGKGGGKPRK